MTNTHTHKRIVTATETVTVTKPYKQNIKKLKIYLSNESKTRCSTK